jgi:hypothetical protein
MAVALPWIMMGLMAAGTATSVYAATRTPQAPDMSALKPPSDKQALEAAYAQAEQMRKRRGSSSTILTGPLGVQTPPTTTQAQLGG